MKLRRLKSSGTGAARHVRARVKEIVADLLTRSRRSEDRRARRLRVPPRGVGAASTSGGIRSSARIVPDSAFAGRRTCSTGGASPSDRPFIETLRGLMADFRSPCVPDLPRFTGGAVGYLGYGAASWFEPVLGDLGGGVDGADLAGFMLFDTVLAFDHVQHRILIIANARITADDDLESLYQFARAKIEFLERELGGASLRAGSTSGLDSRRTAPGNALRSRSAPRGAHRGRRHLPGRSIAAVRGGGRGRSLHRIPRAPAWAVPPYFIMGGIVRGRVVARDAGAIEGPRRDASIPHPAARCTDEDMRMAEERSGTSTSCWSTAAASRSDLRIGSNRSRSS
jgi:hypothetical protein